MSRSNVSLDSVIAYVHNDDMRVVNELEALQHYCGTFTTQREAAKALGISQAYLSDLVNGRRDITEGIASKLGIKRISVKEKAS